MNYRGHEIFSEVRTLEQWSLDDEGNQAVCDPKDSESEDEGYWYRDETGMASENYQSIDELKAAIDQSQPEAEASAA